MSYLGVDLHQNSITICRREADGSEVFETLTLSPADLDRFCLSLDADDEVAIEATKAFAAGEADLATVRGDIGDLSAARTVVLVTYGVVMIVTPPGSSPTGSRTGGAGGRGAATAPSTPPTCRRTPGGRGGSAPCCWPATPASGAGGRRPPTLTT